MDSITNNIPAENTELKNKHKVIIKWRGQLLEEFYLENKGPEQKRKRK